MEARAEVKNDITVTVNGTEWNRVLNLYEMKENDNCYIVSAGYDNTLNILSKISQEQQSAANESIKNGVPDVSWINE